MSYPDAEEEFLTRMFHGKFAAILKLASVCRFIEDAFLKDLKAAFPNIGEELKEVAGGLVADMTLHRRNTERITGGDFGLLLVRPHVSDCGYYLSISDYRRGLLCQAKLKDRSGKWGRFTPNQRKILPSRLSYLSLLMYSYSDDARQVLQPFLWQPCEEHEFPAVESWLATGRFPKPYSSDHTIAKLGYALIGTDDASILDEVVCPVGNPCLVIRIHWQDEHRPGGPGPSSSILIHSRHQEATTQTVRVWQ